MAAARGTISWALLPSLPLRILPGQSDAGAEIATWAVQQPCRTSLDIVLILSQAMPVGWRNCLEEVEAVLICVLNQAAEVEVYAPGSDLPGSRQGRRNWMLNKLSA